MKEHPASVWVVMLAALAVLVGTLAGAAGAGSVATAAGVQAKAKLAKNLAGLNGPFDLAGERKPEVRYFIQETTVIRMGFDGKRISSETFMLKLKCVPAALSGKGGDEFTVREFSIRAGEGQDETIPALAGWSYVFSVGASGKDEKARSSAFPIDLATRWVRKVILDEFVGTETRLPAMGQGPAAQGQKIQAYTVRHFLIRLVSREEFEK